MAGRVRCGRLITTRSYLSASQQSRSSCCHPTPPTNGIKDVTNSKGILRASVWGYLPHPHIGGRLLRSAALRLRQSNPLLFSHLSNCSPGNAYIISTITLRGNSAPNAHREGRHDATTTGQQEGHEPGMHALARHHLLAHAKRLWSQFPQHKHTPLVHPVVVMRCRDPNEWQRPRLPAEQKRLVWGWVRPSVPQVRPAIRGASLPSSHPRPTSHRGPLRPCRAGAAAAAAAGTSAQYGSSSFPQPPAAGPLP